ncbi:B-cell linker protein isoform X2 [Brachyhypopomus gauderio]|uniref:B-cell linker protein isoform X2 n=1 Tax=Brachyhypopomus gauderio TaxID=698409 RepID=UPI004040FD41
MSLPTRDQVEEWSPAQVAGYLSQNKMRECASTVQRMQIDGRWFLNLSDNDLTKFSLIHRPQLQKMVQDIKKNDDSIFNRLKRIKSKGPPKVPARDYHGDDQEQWSGSEFDSDVYEDPQGDHDDSYEPPPCERVFAPTQSMNYSAGEYLDSCPGRQTQTKPKRILRPIKSSIQEKQIPERPIKNDEDYVDPEDNMDEDNYIDPSGKDHKGNHRNKHSPRRSHSPDVYEVPDKEDSPGSRGNAKLQPPPLRLPPKPSPRTNLRKPVACPDPEAEEDYEVCNDECLNENPEKPVEDVRPTPLPRDLKNPKFQLLQVCKCSIFLSSLTTLVLSFTIMFFIFQKKISGKSFEVAPTNVAQDSASPGPSQATKGFYRIKMPLPRDAPGLKSTAEKGSLSQEDGGSTTHEEEAGVFNKPWYTSTSDRKTAEDTLIRSAMDGSYLVRKSSGVDALQPFTLVVFYNSRVYNIPIRYVPETKQYALGKQKSGEERFKSVSEIIENHQRNALVLVDTQSLTKDSTRLKHALTP